jgi:membrane protease YdiL (CAAX protease family)
LGFAAHALPFLASLLLLATMLLLTAAFFAILSVKDGPTAAARVILPGLTFFVWALLASRISILNLERASLAVLFLVLLMTVLGLKLQPGPTARRLGIALSFLLTAGAFTLVHGEQLGGAWGPLLVLLVVSTVLTFTRARTKSLASSFLIHFAYNSTLFGGLYFATDHFRHLERMAR